MAFNIRGALQGLAATAAGVAEAQVAILQAKTEQDRLRAEQEFKKRSQELQELMIQQKQSQFEATEDRIRTQEQLNREQKTELQTEKLKQERMLMGLGQAFEMQESEKDRQSRERIAEIRTAGTSRGIKVDLSKWSGQRQLNARNLIRERFDGVLARRDEMVQTVLELEDQGKTIDEIDDAIRESSVSKEFVGPIRQAFNSLAITLPKAQRDQLEHTIDSELEKGNIEGAQRELMSGIIKQMGDSEQKRFQDRQDMLSSLSEIQNGFDELEKLGITIGPGTAIETWIAQQLRQSNDPRIIQIGQRMENIFVQWRKTMSGVSFGDKENEQYERIFPRPDKNLNMNRAILDSLIQTNLMHGRNALEVIVPNLRDVIPEENLDDFLIGTVNPPETLTGLSPLESLIKRFPHLEDRIKQARDLGFDAQQIETFLQESNLIP